MNKILVGADPEVFAFRGGRPISAHGLIRGDKKNPFKVEGGAVQVDGMALEFNIDPAGDEQNFINNLNRVMATLAGMVPEYQIQAVPVAEFGFEYIQQQPREALELGCEPDFDAWAGGDVNTPPNGRLPFRTGAGHVHVGWIPGNDADTGDYFHHMACVERIKQLDFFLGLGSLFFDDGVKRREMYGRPGCFRPKSYGAEYRVLSNKWLTNDELKGWVFRNTVEAMNRFEEGYMVADREDTSILHNLMLATPDLAAVAAVMKRHSIELPLVA